MKEPPIEYPVTQYNANIAQVDNTLVPLNIFNKKIQWNAGESPAASCERNSIITFTHSHLHQIQNV